MTKLFQLRNSLSNRILTTNQQSNTKGRGRGDQGKSAIDFFTPTPAFTTGNLPTKKYLKQREVSGPPSFVPGNTGNSSGPII